MDFEHFRHYARGWLLHFFGQEEKAFNEYAAAYRLRPNNARAAATWPSSPPAGSSMTSPTSGLSRRCA
jgi:hypothetical protein